MQKTILSTALILTLGATVANSEIHYNAADAVRYAYEHTKKGCEHKTRSNVKACISYWNTREYPHVDEYDGRTLNKTNCIGFVSEALVAGGIPTDDTPTLEWYYQSYAWNSIKWFLGRVFTDADTETNGIYWPHYQTYPEYNYPRVGVWDDLEPVMVEPKKAVAGDIAFSRNKPWLLFHHAVIVTKSYNPRTGCFSYTGHTSDVVDADACDLTSNNWQILHFTRNATYTNIPTYEDVHPSNSSSSIIWTTKHLTANAHGEGDYNYLTGKPNKNVTSKSDRHDREYTDFLHGDNSHKTVKVYKIVREFPYGDERVKIMLHGIDNRYTDEEGYLHIGLKSPSLTIYHKRNGKRIIDLDSNSYVTTKDYKYNLVVFTLKEGIDYFVAVKDNSLDDRRNSNKRMTYIFYVKDI